MTDSAADDEGALTHAGAVGETRRLTLFFADLVDSTALSTQVEPETYRLVVGRYREQVVRIVSAYNGHIGSTKGSASMVTPARSATSRRRATKVHLFATHLGYQSPGARQAGRIGWVLRGIASAVPRIQANRKAGIPVIEKPCSDSGPSWTMNAASSSGCIAAPAIAR